MSQAVADHLGLPLESVEMPGNPGDFDPDPTGANARETDAYRQASDRGSTAGTTVSHARRDRVPYENPISMMLVRMMARTNGLGARVTLTGAGSDQLLFPTGFEIQGALRRGDVRRALELSGVLAAPFAAGSYARLLRDGVGRSLPLSFRRALRRLRGRGDGLPTWMTEAARAAVRRAEEATPPSANRGDFPSPAAQVLADRIAGNADYSYGLVLADRIAAGASADMRHPFFDRRVIDLLLSFPDEVRSAGPPPKALLRGAMGASLPAVVRDRRSAAEFSVLVRRALVEPHGERLATMVRRGRLADAGLIDGDAAAAAILRARTEDDTIREVMVLAWLEVWLRALQP